MDHCQLCLLLNEVDYNPLWTEPYFNCLMYFVLTKSVCILLRLNILLFWCLLGYFVFSLLAFCKPLDLNSHYVLKIVRIVCDGIVGRHYSQILRRYCVLVAFLITGLEYKILAHCL